MEKKKKKKKKKKEKKYCAQDGTTRTEDYIKNSMCKPNRTL